MTTTLDYALRYASFGWPVLPVQPRAKVPLGGRGYAHATLDEVVIRQWWAVWPDANIGIALAPAGLAAIDIDPRNGGTPDAVDIPAGGTLTAKTGGGGLHLLTRVQDGANLPGKLGAGIDLKHKGYILVEPSIHPSGEVYNWLDWDVLTEPVPAIIDAPDWLLRKPEQASNGAGGNHADWLSMLLDGEAVHDNALRLVGHLVAIGMSTKTIRATMAALAIGVTQARGAERAKALTGAELDRMIAGARRNGFAPPPIPEIDDDPGDEPDDGQPSEPKAQRISQAPMESDIWLSALFAKRFAGELRWSAGLDWMLNLGTHWTRDEQAVRLTRAKAMCAQISRAATIANDTRRSIASAKTVGAVLTLAKAESGISTPADAWDRDPMVLNTPAGPFDLETGKPVALRTDLDLYTQVTSVAPDAAMRMPNWLRFVSEIFNNDLEMVEFMQRLAGYCLTGDRREQKLPFFWGVGSNGKSVFLDLLLSIMGSYALNLPSEALMRQQHPAHPTELAQLRGKRLAVSSELEDGTYWAESRIKALTGDATLTARFMRQDFFEFRQTQKHIVSGNFKPRLKGDDPAIARRMVLVPFNERFTGTRCDPLLPKKLEAEHSGILAWAIAGARKWARDGLLIPQSVRDASAEYLNANDDICLWVEECCVTGPLHRTPTATLYKSFSDWKGANGERAQSVNPWSARMAQRFKQYRTMHGRGFEGLALRDLSEPAYSYAQAGA